MDQVPFAQFLGVTQSRVSEWESGKVKPSPEMYLRLASQGSPKETVFFLEQAGVGREALEVAAGEILGARSAAAVLGEIFRIPRFRLTHHKLEESGPAIVLSREFITNPASTIGIQGQSGGAVLLVDSSNTELPGLIGKDVAIDSSHPRPWDNLRRPAGLIAGKLDLVEEEGEATIRWFATLSAHTPEETRIAGWEYPKPKKTHWPPRTDRDFQMSAKARFQSMQEAPHKLDLFDGYRILGEWIGWIVPR
jgi:transcriptional regulator with XRE-family HTH domain